MSDNFGFKPEFLNPNAPPIAPPIMYDPSMPYPVPSNIHRLTGNFQPFPASSTYPPPPSSSSYPAECYPTPPQSYYKPPPVVHPNQPPTYPQWGSNNVTGGHKAYYWTDWSAHHRMVPPTAVHGGVDKDGTQIYVGRAYHEGDWIPAKVIPEKNVAYVAHAGGEHAKDSFQVLCEQRFDWIPTSGGNIPPGAVEGGRTESGEALFVGRVSHDGAHTVGKVHPSHGTCYIPYGGEELAFQEYEILVLRM